MSAVRVVVLLSFVSLIVSCGGPSSSDSGDGGPNPTPGQDGGEPKCESGEVCACTSDSDCRNSFCECKDATCSERVCSPKACACSAGPDCEQPLDDGVTDPNSCTGTAMCHGGLCLDEPADPGPPAFPDVIETLSVVIRTKDGDISGTSDRVSLCLSSSDCYVLDRPGLNDLRRASVDSFQFEGLALPRSQVDRVELRISGADDWEPECLALRFDGEPMYCVDPAPFILGDAVGAVATWRDPEGYRIDCTSCFASTLTHGPMIGAVEATTARIWIRTDATRRVGLRLSGSAEVATAPVVDWVYPAAKDDFTAVLHARNLQPSTTYHYAIDIDGVLVTDTAYSFTTPPSVGTPTTFRFGVGSCSRTDHTQGIFGPLAETKPDLFLFIGDNHYGDVTTLDELRWFYQWIVSAPPRGEMLARVPSIAVWDDHDFLGNNSDGTDPRRPTARRVFKEYWANPGYGEADEGIYYKHSYGDVEFFMLDDRYFRDPLDGPVMYGDAEGRASILGARQTQWLIEQLAASKATFKFVVSGSQWTDFGKTDSWASFQAARDAVFDEIERLGIEGVVLLSGDRHRTELRSLPRTTGYNLPELTSSPMANVARDCTQDPDLVSCHDQGYYVVLVDVDTTVADPELVATVHLYSEDDDTMTAVDEWRIKRSELSLD